MLIPALAILVAIGILALAYATLIEPAWLRIRHRVVPIAGLPGSSAGLRILHLSDLHVGRSTDRIRRFIERGSAIPADIIVITGDFIDHPKHIPQLPEALASITAAGTPVLAILGNHDHFAYAHRFVRSAPSSYDPASLIDTIRGLGIDLLVDEVRQVPTRVGDVSIVGIDLHSHTTGALARTLAGVSGPRHILLAHSPDAIHAAIESDIALLLCGHTHGGQVRIGPWITPTTSTRTPVRPPAGLIVKGNTTMHISPGIGITYLPLRFFSRPEITLIELVPQTES